MKYSAFLLALVCVMTACSGQRKAPPSAAQALEKAAKDETAKQALATQKKVDAKNAKLPAADAKCQVSQAITDAVQAGDTVGYLDHLEGRYDLQSVEVYGQLAGVDDDKVSSYNATVTIADRGEDVDFKETCKDIQKAGDVSVYVPTTLTIHAPSMRLSVNDADLSSTNALHLVEINFKSDGTSSGKFNSGEAPLDHVLQFKHIAEKWPEHKISPRKDGKKGFQILYTDKSKGYAQVLMTFGQN